MATKKQKCSICNQVPEPDCDYRQGRCPHLKPIINLKTKTVKQPDPKLHRNISFVKSGLRIVAGLLLCVGQLFAAGALLILAEVLGIVEELV